MEVCEAPLQSPQEALISQLGLEAIQEKMNHLVAISTSQPMSDNEIVYEKIREEHLRYEGLIHQREQTLSLLQRVLAESPQIAELMNDYTLQKIEQWQEIDLQTASSESLNKFAERDEQRALLLIQLREQFQDVFFHIISTSVLLEDQDKEFLTDSLFYFLENTGSDITYQWTNYADQAHRYLWDLLCEHSQFDGPTGSHGNSRYWIETNLNSSHPGLALHLPVETQIEENSVRMNMSFSFSPFLEESLSLTICDFSLSLNPNFCSPLSVSEWCTAHGL